jgi:glutamate N-acetyltransferase/amino-acid N-acetyltransferase
MEHIKGAGVCAPLGFSASSAVADVKGNGKGKKDMALLYSEVPFNAAAVFTSNKFCAAPVIHGRELIGEKGKFSAIVVNSGNANACTGEKGLAACNEITAAFADELGVDEKAVLISSTGVIGVQLPVDKMASKASELIDELDSSNSTEFAEAIMTTDAVKKEYAVLVETPNGAYVVAGAAKGAGMIAPSMATMLAFITTDAAVKQDTLQDALNYAMADSFNSITVDGDMSTNDTVFLFANGMSGVIPNRDEFFEAVKTICVELAKMIVRDGEGATKFCTFKVVNAATDEDAKKCAFALANSPLVKTMLHGEDPNWGRIFATVGACGIECRQDNVDLYFEDLKYAENGVIIDYALEPKAAAIMKKTDIEITVDLKEGTASKTVYTCDFTKEYISINADYRS